MAMFEVNVFTPEQFGAFIPWLAVWRGNLSVLVHPNTYQPGESQAVNDLKDHTERAIWMGERVPLDVSLFQRTIVAEQTAHAGDVRHTAA
ncbi:DOPA 4,5-dioxygenase [Geosmithia morbida]|uniref:DOPA 4,5-dioxygenase n=1 Tax=Geosmithia morbida TaxID=1094350 RepID=A0A9P4YUW1_9HYPO|nr:DOPA 4,5-dioxygenase [Geosmithia morbida]KAF4122128.1 DOPA 4,5-dioxygenase [Geosmithia morbida]